MTGVQLIEDDAEVNPTIPEPQFSYIKSLTDTHTQYTRFFDALLIPRPSHRAFLRDLKGFRTLPTTIKAFTLCDPEDVSISKEQRKENYRDVTKRYIGSRFAHPWCRKAMAGSGNSQGWWGAEWSATGRKMSKEQQDQEDKLHKLLIPIWVGFRSKMFPGQAVVDEWWEEHQVQLQAKEAAERAKLSEQAATSTTQEKKPVAYKELSMATNKSKTKSSGTAGIEDEAQEEALRQQAGVAATGLMRLAAASMIINSMPKMQKWKLKRELKKQMNS